MKKSFILVVSICLMNGCTTFYNMPQENLLHENYPSTHKVNSDHIVIEKQCKAELSDFQFALLKINSTHESKKHYQFMTRVLNDLGIETVYSEEELVQRILTEGVNISSTSTSDLLSLKKISDVMGRFLFIESEFQFIYSARWENHLKVIDAGVPETILEVREGDILWSSFDQEFSYPHANLIRRVLVSEVKNQKGTEEFDIDQSSMIVK